MREPESKKMPNDKNNSWDASSPSNPGKEPEIFNTTSKEQILIKAFKFAIEKGFTHAITIDADFQHDPQYINEFISIIMCKLSRL